MKVSWRWLLSLFSPRQARHRDRKDHEHELLKSGNERDRWRIDPRRRWYE